MKMSLKRRLGFVHVRGGRVLKVAHDHQVPVRFQNSVDTGEAMRTFDTPWVTAKVGDLALEIVAVKTGKVVGHTYIAGDAITLNRYSDTPAHWFSPAVALRLDMQSEGFLSLFVEQNWTRIAAGLMLANNDTAADVIVFDTKAANKEDAENAWKAISSTLSYVPTTLTDDQVAKLELPNWIGRISYPNNTRDGGVLVACSQPARHAHKFPVNGFQTLMIVDIDLPIFSPWDQIDTAEEVPA